MNWDDLLETITKYELVSGLVGAVLAGVVTLVGIWLVIRHERRMRIEQALDEAIVELDERSRALLKVFTDHDLRIERWDEAAASAHFHFTNAMVMAIARAKKRESTLHRALKDLLEHTHPSKLKIGDGRGLGATMQLTVQWLSDPKQIRRRWPRKQVTAKQLMAQSTLDRRDAGNSTDA